MAAGFPTRWGRPTIWRSARLRKIFIQSTHDQYGPRRGAGSDVRSVSPSPSNSIWIEAADHFFAGGLEELEERVKVSAGQLTDER